VQAAWALYFEKFNKDIQPKDNERSTSTPSQPSTSSESLTWDALQSKIKTDAAWVQRVKENNEKFGMQMDTLTAGKAAITQADKNLSEGRSGKEEVTSLLEGARDVLSAWLDKKQGHTVTDPAIFRNLAAYWEKSFYDDMDRLHVEPPTTLTRVSEYLPEITQFVERIIQNGYAYATEDGDVYFDRRRFDGAAGNANAGSADWCHTYAKLQPWSKGNSDLLDEGEGTFSDAVLPSVRAQSRKTLFARLAYNRAREEVSCRLCTLESFKTGRAVVAKSMGQRSTGLAHRVLRDGIRGARRADGHSFWRS